MLFDESEAGGTPSDDDDTAFLGREAGELDSGEFEVWLFGYGVKTGRGEVVRAGGGIESPEFFAPVHWKEQDTGADVSSNDGAELNGTSGGGDGYDVIMGDVSFGSIIGMNFAEGGIDVPR